MKRESNYKFVKKRMSKAKKEIMHWNEYDYVVVNDRLDKCINTIKSIIKHLCYKPINLKL